MIAAIERNKFTYLYKYGKIHLDYNQVIDLSIEQIKQILRSDLNFLTQELNRVLPVFEQDHEVLLLDLNKDKISVEGRLLISFNAVNAIYPLSNIGRQLLDGKINNGLRISDPFVEVAVEEVKIWRSIQSCDTATKNLLSYFSLTDSISEKNLGLLKTAIRKLLSGGNGQQHLDNYLEHLLSYNKTPSYIPEGHVEYLCKIGAVAMIHLGKPEDAFTNGPFYKSCVKHKNEINAGSLIDSFKYFLTIHDENFKSSYSKVLEIISEGFGRINMFKVSYFFLAFKSYLNKNELNLLGLENEILKLKADDKEAAGLVLSMIGYSFSFEQLYESLHVLNKVPVLKSSQKSESTTVKKEKTSVTPLEEKEVKNEENPANLIITIQPTETQKQTADFVEKDLVENFVREPAGIPEDEITSEKEKGVSVDEFRKWVNRGNFSKVKKGLWDKFIDDHLLDKVQEITLDELVSKIELMPGFKEKTLTARKDKDSLREFFATHKA